MSIRQVEIAGNADLEFKPMPQWGLNGTYTEVFTDKPVALEFANHLVGLKASVETARQGGRFIVSWTGKYIDTQAWRKQRLQRKA